MANISVRNLDDDIVKRLRIRAVEHGCSMEAEVRKILSDTVLTPERLGDFAIRIFSPTYETDGEFELPERETTEPMTFD